MNPTIHVWPVRPVVTLISEYWTWDTQWHGIRQPHTFISGIHNVLKLLVEFKYKKPYGGSARYRVQIDRVLGSTMTNVMCETVSFFTNDDVWHSSSKEYEIPIELPLFRRNDSQIDFRITAQIEGPGHMDTGSGSGSLGSFSDPEWQDYKAIFKPPELHLVQAHVKYLESSLQDALKDYQNRIPH